MKDQLALLRKCIVNDIPAIVFQGDDMLASFVVHESNIRIHGRLVIRVIRDRCRNKLQTDFRHLKYREVPEDRPHGKCNHCWILLQQ